MSCNNIDKNTPHMFIVKWNMYHDVVCKLKILQVMK